MKIRNKIAAAFTAAALMFTMTDPAALGGMLNAASTAFAAVPVSMIELKQSNPLSSPEADQALWDSSAVKVNGEYVAETKVEWYREDGTQETSGIADYNEKYSVKIKLLLARGYEAGSSVTMYYYTVEDGASTQSVAMTVDGDYLVATINFKSRTGLPNADQAVFPVSATTDGTSNRTSIELPVYSNKNNIISALPKYARILTGTSSHRGDPIDNVSITWTNSAGNFIFEKGTFNEDDVTGQEFTLTGTVSMAGYSQYINNPSVSFNLYCTVKIRAADQLEPPEPRTDTMPGDYDHNLTVYLTAKEGTIYYTVNESPDSQNLPVGGNADQKYLNGIPLKGVEGDTKTYYINVLAYDPKKLTSNTVQYVYSITLEPSSLTNIPEVRLEVDKPVGGEILNTVARYEGGTVTKGVAVTSSVAWIGNVKNGRADYNATYSISIQLTPKNMFAFNKTQAYVNGVLANCSTNESGTLTVTYKFPGRTGKLALYRVIPPADTVVVDNGTDIKEIGDRLPTMLDVEAPEGTLLEDQYPVRWDLNTSEPLYDPKLAKSQTFTLTGTVTMPDFITYKEDQNKVKVNVFVGAAGALAWPTAAPSDSTQGHMFYDAVDVTLSASEGATIYYTIGENKDAEVPTVTGGRAYNAPIRLYGNPGEVTTYYIKAIATAPGKNDSPVNSFVYTITLPKRTVADPTANYASGTYQQSLDIALNCTTVGSDIYYTTDPSAKLAEFVKYTGVFRLAGQANSTKTYNIRFYALDPSGKMIPSNVVSRDYTLSLPKNKALAPYPNYTSGVAYEKSISVTLKCDTPNTKIYYTLNGKDPSVSGNGTEYKNAFTLKYVKNEVTTYTLKAYAVCSDLNVDPSPVVTYTYTMGLDYGVKSIKITKRPNKSSYYLGESLNAYGGKIEVTYDDGTTETIDMDEDMIDDFDNWTIGQQTLTVYYKGCTAKFNVVVRKRPSASTEPDTPSNPAKPTDSDKPKDDTTTTDDSETVSAPVVDGTTVKGWTQIQKKIAAAEKGSRVKIKLNGTTSVPADVINSAIKRKLTLEFIVNDNISWVVDTGKLKKTVASFSAGIKTRDVYIPSVLIDNAGGSEVMRIHTYGANKIGAVLYVKTGSKIRNRFANLFRYNEDSEKLDFQATSKVSTSTGIATLVPSAGGEYVVMLDTQTRLPGDADNSTTIDARDAAAILKAIVVSSDIDDSWDYNGDGFVNAIDSAKILKAVVGAK